MPRYHSTGRCRSFLAGSAIAILLAIFAVPGAGLAADKAKLVTVVTTESKFTPNKLTFRRGIPYRLHVENRGKQLHEFNAADFFKTAKISNPAVLNPDKTEIVLRPGEAKDLNFINKQIIHIILILKHHYLNGLTGKI